MNRFQWLRPYLPDYLRIARYAWLALFIEVLVDLSIPTLIADIVDNGVLTGNDAVVLRTGGLMLALALFGAVLGQLRNLMSTKVSQDLGTRIRADLFRKSQRLSLAAFQEMGAATLLTRQTNDVMQIQNFSFMLTRIFIRAPLLVIGGILMAFTLNPRLALMLTLLLPVIIALVLLRVRKGIPLFADVQRATDRVNGVMREFLNGIRVVRVFDRHDEEQRKFDEANERLTGDSVRASRSLASIQPTMMLLLNGAIVGAMWLGGLSISTGAMKPGEIIAFVNYALQILQAMIIVSRIFSAAARARTSSDRIAEVFALDDGMAEPQNPVCPERTGRVSFQDVSFRWPGQREAVLSDIRFTLEPGRTVAVIGTTGSGKSTLVNLIPRLHDVDGGVVRVDGEDVRNLSLADLRARIAMVPQKAVLFSGTIADNLRWGRGDAGPDEMMAACRAACADEFIERFPDGLETWIGQGGVNLSGGQKQRLGIARALLRGAPVLILDDSTSAVDMLTERRMRSRMREHAAGMSLLLVAQRIHSVMGADLILVMDGGRMVGSGTHQELLAGCELYREIYRSQIGLDPDGREAV